MSSLEIFDCIQGSESWFACRLGIPTASEFHTVLAEGRKKGEPSVTRRKYMNRLAAERYMGKVCEEDRYTNPHLERGKELEAEAAHLYAFASDRELKTCGFFKHLDHEAGCSPDRLAGDDGIASIKTALPHILTDYIRRDTFPAEHKAQSQGELWITGRAWVDIVIYWPGMPLFVKRCTSDPQYITELAAKVKTFNSELTLVLADLRRYGRNELKEQLKASVAA